MPRSLSPVGALQTKNVEFAKDHPFYFITPPSSSFRNESSRYLGEELDHTTFVARASQDDPSNVDALTRTYDWETTSGKWVRHEYAIEASSRPKARLSGKLSRLLEEDDGEAVITLPIQESRFSALDESLWDSESLDLHFQHVSLDENQVPLVSTGGSRPWDYEAAWLLEIDDSLDVSLAGHTTDTGFPAVVHPWLVLRVFSHETGHRPKKI
ncbi:hypothetical protein L198_00820 [Cryptococcus wingfieldii CBS 7118]|uniref:Uncharacterized protein n=1 Tax=Cryptococcus wingfieldii CBS 7118 TaxID=1295528 RepID=A0A1E3K2K1_9TREE|nr:hypothetical protein L198_00820 [Cryptococcus wingfieldii CBS 7118]ODO07241.1 hypothetical protein L198_00820 [Cryptococcus wingfieldii CBS 7118]